MNDDIDTLLIDVRANTEGFNRDVAHMRALIDGDLLTGFNKAGTALENGLVNAIRKGSLSFGDLKQTATAALDAIATQATKTLTQASAGETTQPISGTHISGLLSSILGLPGRATGGNVSPGRGYLVGERGPELFVPTSAGRVETTPSSQSRDVKVSINLTAASRSTTPQSLQRSSRQVASAVRRALIQP